MLGEIRIGRRRSLTGTCRPAGDELFVSSVIVNWVGEQRSDVFAPTLEGNRMNQNQNPNQRPGQQQQGNQRPGQQQGGGQHKPGQQQQGGGPKPGQQQQDRPRQGDQHSQNH